MCMKLPGHIRPGLRQGEIQEQLVAIFSTQTAGLTSSPLLATSYEATGTQTTSVCGSLTIPLGSGCITSPSYKLPEQQ